MSFAPGRRERYETGVGDHSDHVDELQDRVPRPCMHTVNENAIH